MSLSLLTPPATEPVTLAEAKAHLKIDTSDEDALLETLITAARARAEWHTGRAFVSQSWCLKCDTWPPDGIAEIPLPPLQTVSEIAITDANGIRTVLTPPHYCIDIASEPGRVIFDEPQHNLRRHDALEIAFTAGYGNEAAVPAAVKEAILQIVADLYTHRGDDGDTVSPAGQALLAPYRIFRL